MSRLRLNPLTGRWITVVAGRAERPSDFAPRVAQVEADPSRPCPFCPGSEDATPPALETYSADGGDWLVRVVPNLYPAFSGDEPLTVTNEGPVFISAPASGIHEVLVLSPQHSGSFADLDDRADRVGDGCDPRPDGGARVASGGSVHAGDREPRARSGRVARASARAAPRHAVRPGSDPRGGSGLRSVRGQLPAVRDGRGRARR